LVNKGLFLVVVGSSILLSNEGDGVFFFLKKKTEIKKITN